MHAFHLGILASAIHRRSMLQARTGRWGYGISCSSAPGFPLLRSMSIISCRLVSHLTGSPNRITPGRFQEMLGNSQSLSTELMTKSHPLAKAPLCWDAMAYTATVRTRLGPGLQSTYHCTTCTTASRCWNMAERKAGFALTSLCFTLCEGSKAAS